MIKKCYININKKSKHAINNFNMLKKCTTDIYMHAQDHIIFFLSLVRGEQPGLSLCRFAGPPVLQ